MHIAWPEGEFIILGEFIYLVLQTEGTSTFSWSRFCTLNCQPMGRNYMYQLSHLRSGRELNSDLRVGRQECYHSATVIPYFRVKIYLAIFAEVCAPGVLSSYLIVYFMTCCPKIFCTFTNIEFHYFYCACLIHILESH